MNFSLTTEEGIIEGEGKNMSMDHTDHMGMDDMDHMDHMGMDHMDDMDHMDHMDHMGMSEHHHGDHFRGMDAPGDDSGTSFLKNHPKANFTH